MSYSTIIERLDIFMWAVDFCVLLAVAWYSKVDKEFKSTLVTLLIATVLGFLMVSYSPDLKQFIRASDAPGGDVTWFNIGLFGWYVGFTVIDIFAMLAIWKIHQWYNINYSYPTYAFLFSYMCLALLQITRYAERLTIDLDYTKAFYNYSVLSINVGTSLTALIVVIGVSVSRHRMNKGKRGLSWSL